VLSGSSREQVLRQFEGKGYGVLKKAVAEIVIERVGEIQARYNEIRADEGYLDKTLADGAQKAAAVADETLRKAMELTGLL
jgi:tryptophanyl-tRNA synthetase